MKWMPLIVFFLSFYSWSVRSQNSWNGTFEGNVIGVTARLVGQKSNAGWTATIDANNYIIHLQGSIVEMQSTGTMSDPQAGTSIPYAAILKGNQIILKIEDMNPLSGQVEKMEFIFTRTKDQENETDQISLSPSGKPADRATHDQNLVGTWRFTDSYVSGEFSFATDWFIWFYADGTFKYSEGRTAGGGPDVSADTGAGDVGTATWKSENKSISLDEGNGWQFYAKYYRENNYLMLTYGNGKKQVWEKI